jgi:hypothetical protein
MATKPNVLNEVNDMRRHMGLPLLSESELLNLEINELLNEGTWENVKYALSKLGRYKAGGKIFGKSQTDAKALAQITALLDKVGNEKIKELDRSIKQSNPEFPNNKSQQQFLDTIIEIATLYDSLVAATKLKPNDKGYLPVDAANAIIDDLRAYTQKYLDVDLTAAFSVFNENEEIGTENWITPDKVESDYGFYSDMYKDVYGVRPHGQSAEQLCNWLNSEFKLDGNMIVRKDGQDELYEADLDATKAKVAGKFADTKAAVKSGDLKAYDTQRMKTLKSWRLPLALLGAGASFGALSWLIEYIFPPEKITTMTPETVKQTTQELIGNVNPGEGMTQIMNRTMGLNLSPSSNPNDVVAALKTLGGGNAQTGVDIITQQGGIFRDPAAAKETLSAIVANPTEHGTTLKQVFTGTWAGTGKMAGDTLVTVSGGNLVGMVTKAFTTWVAKTTTIKSAKAIVAAPILKGLGILLAAGAVATALGRYKGRKSSRAQIMNDLVQYIRPIEGTKDNPDVVDDPNKDDGGDNKQQGGGGNDKQLYDNLKKYFQDIFNFKAQTNTDTYGKGGSGNATKQYSGGGRVTSKVTQPNDIDDILKLMEEDLKLYESLCDMDMLAEADSSLMRSINTRATNVDTSDKGLADIGLSQNQLKLFKTHVMRLSNLIKIINKFNSGDKNLNKLVAQAKSNPIFNKITDDKVVGIDINELLKSDPKSLKIFVSDFNKAVYATQFKNGNNIMDQLKNIGINKLSEAAVRTPSKSQANAVYNARREFLQNFPNLVKSFYAIFSYLIDLAKKGGLTSGSNRGTGQGTGSGQGTGQGTGSGQGGSGQGGQQGSGSGQGTGTGSGQQGGGSGQGTGSGQNVPKDSSGFTDLDFRRNPLYLEESIELIELIEAHDNLNSIIESVLKEFGENQPEMEQGKQDAVKNSDSGRIFTQLARVVPDLSTKIASEYKQAYGQQINRVKLANFLQTVLGALANVPQQKMVQLINRADMDVTAYRRMLRDIKAGGGEQGQVGQQQAQAPQFNPGTPEKFLPDTVGNYDLSKINQSARIALAQKAAQIISRNTDMKLDSTNMMEVMKQLLDDISKNGQKQIPTI